MFVFMDGVAQCNRNRRGLVIPDEKTTSAQTEIDFRVRQKEDKFDDRRFIGREWSFAQLNTSESRSYLDSLLLILGSRERRGSRR